MRVVVSQQHPRTTHGAPPRFIGARATILAPPPRRAVDEEFAVDQEEALSHSGEPETRPSLFPGWIEANAIVLHRKLKLATDRAKLDLDRAGA